MVDRSKFVHKNVTVVIGSDEETDTTVIFLVKEDGCVAFSFPKPLGYAVDLAADQMETFLAITPPSEMLSAIADAWKERQKREEVVQ